MLLNECNMPNVSPRNSLPAPAIPSMPFGVVPSIVSSIAPSNTRRSVPGIGAPQQGKTCVYQFRRGLNKGQYCNKSVAPGSEYCPNCLKRNAINKELASKGVSPGPAPGFIPGMSGMDNHAVIDPSDTQESQLSVIPYDEEKGWYREIDNNFIVYEASPNNILVIGKLDTDSNSIVLLTNQEKTIAKNLGLCLPNDNTSSSDGEDSQSQSQAQPQKQSTPASSHPAIPSIPNISKHSSAVSYAIPQVNHMASIPQIPAVPSVN
jgi:hypothetical protein